MVWVSLLAGSGAELSPGDVARAPRSRKLVMKRSRGSLFDHPPLEGEGRQASSHSASKTRVNALTARCLTGWGELSRSPPHPACLRCAPASDPPPPGEGEEHHRCRSFVFRT